MGRIPIGARYIAVESDKSPIRLSGSMHQMFVGSLIVAPWLESLSVTQMGWLREYAKSKNLNNYVLHNTNLIIS